MAPIPLPLNLKIQKVKRLNYNRMYNKSEINCGLMASRLTKYVILFLVGVALLLALCSIIFYSGYNPSLAFNGV